MKLKLMAIVLVLLVSASGVYAELHDRGNGLIYDDVLDVTWRQDVALSGWVNYSTAVSWVDTLDYGGFSDWRLPNTPGTAQGFINEGETGHLYYTELGNSAGSYNINVGPFINMPATQYNVPDIEYNHARFWLNGEPLQPDYAWDFTFRYDNIYASQNYSGMQNSGPAAQGNLYAWAVRDGDVIPRIHCVGSSSELQDALDAASNNSTDDIIKVQTGTYYGNFIYASTESFGLTIEGGYSDAQCNVREVDPTNTALDAQNSGRVLTLDSSGVAADLVVDGLTIQNGNVIGKNGGGFYIHGWSSATLTDNIIDGNNTSTDKGGGVYIEQVNPVVMSYNTLSNNSGILGGGTYVQPPNATTTMHNNIIIHNTAVDAGGVYIYWSDTSNITHNIISHNIAHAAGGFCSIAGNSVRLTNNIVSYNTSTESGGGVTTNHANQVVMKNNF